MSASESRPFGGRWPTPREDRPLTDAERDVLRLVGEWLLKKPYPPTIRDVAKLRNVTVNTARERLNGLIVKGYLGKKEKTVRALWLTELGKETYAALWGVRGETA